MENNENVCAVWPVVFCTKYEKKGAQNVHLFFETVFIII